MNGLAQVILAATPLAAIVLYFALSGQQEIRVDQQRHEMRQQIEEAEFDLEFDQARQSVAIDPPAPGAGVEEKQEKIAQLKEKKAEWEAQFDEDFKQREKELGELKDAIEDMSQ